MTTNLFTIKRITGFASLLLLTACVKHRDIRNGLLDEAIYLDKAPLTAVNPKIAGSLDDGWLFKTTIVKAASPNGGADYAFPGFQSDTKYIKFRFSKEALQIVDGSSLQNDDPEDNNDNLATTTERVLIEFAGSHVDVKLRENLDGERTNYLEENTEEPWQKRQKFKVNLAETSLDPITTMAWYYGDFMHDCVTPVSATVVPNSFAWDDQEQYLSWVIEANYILTVDGGCYDMTNLITGAGTATVQYRMSFYRPGASDFVSETIAEKDPVNKKYGVFQVMQVYRDSNSGLLGAKNLLQRYNPNRTTPLVYYFAQGFPEKYKALFSEIKDTTNAVLTAAGAKLQIDFQDYNAGGIERQFGDIRYSFVVWNQDIDITRGLLGYGPSTVDPRTGEVISADVNLYNVGMDYYRFMIQDYLERVGALQTDANTPWEQQACNEGDTTAPSDSSKRFASGLFNEIRRTLQLDSAHNTGNTTDFVPEIAQDKTTYLTYYNQLANELRFADPLYNPYVYNTANSYLDELKSQQEVEHEFQSEMNRILLNQDPFNAISPTTLVGINKHQEFFAKLRDYKKNHEQFRQNLQRLHKTDCVYTFDANDAITTISQSARKCVNGFYESNEQYSERIIENIVFHVALHEFGHTLGLRHNFYGSVDALHQLEGQVSSSVMDYIRATEEAATPRDWGEYDKAALSWIYGTTDVRSTQMQKDFLYCTDEHADFSPLCTRHDLGVTPAQIVLNAIERYDMLYELRNRRAYRTFWDTTTYSSYIYDAIFPLQRMWYLAIFTWGGGGIQETLKMLDQLQGTVKSDSEYNTIAADFYNDIAATNALTMAFYNAVLNQPSSSRNYSTEYDSYYGDVTRLGIIIDKLFATLAFMDLQEVWNYDPNIYTYVAMFDAPFGTLSAAVALEVLDGMLGANYDTFPWFKYLALEYFAYVTNTNLVDDISFKDRIAIRRFNNQADLEAEFGIYAIPDALRLDNTSQIFIYNGEQYVYTFIAERGWHLVANKSRNPVSYQYMRDFNESLRAGASKSLDNYGLKILLTYYEYYNNFSGQ
ncbi:MAG: zinc-dependent metalloprotease [Deltaproteobacteria bacterium]|nr:zinc-dependent metalloprotease [Deltaproteobacteria bacterium]